MKDTNKNYETQISLQALIATIRKDYYDPNYKSFKLTFGETFGGNKAQD